MINILCFGDSNTFGYKPDGTGRYAQDVRWTGLLQEKAGPKVRILEEGLCGRTTVFQDEFREGRRGMDAIGTAVETHTPVDLLLIMLGTNDCKTRYGATAAVIAKGLEQVIRKALERAAHPMDLMVISPIHLGRNVGEEGYDPEFDDRSERVSRELSREYAIVAERYHALFLDAATVAGPSERDREHLDEAGHRALADAVYEKLNGRFFAA